MSFTYIERRVSYLSCISFPQIPSECVTFMSLENFSVQFFFLKTSLLYALLAVFYYKTTACSFPLLFWLYANYEGYGTLLHSSQGSRTGSSYSQYTIVESSQVFIPSYNGDWGRRTAWVQELQDVVCYKDQVSAVSLASILWPPRDGGPLDGQKKKRKKKEVGRLNQPRLETEAQSRAEISELIRSMLVFSLISPLFNSSECPT